MYLITTDLQVSTFADMEGDETFDSSLLGYADEVVEERIADDDVVMIKGTKSSSAVSIYFCKILLVFAKLIFTVAEYSTYIYLLGSTINFVSTFNCIL